MCIPNLDELDHPRSAIVGLRLVLKFGLDRIRSFGDIVIFYILPFWLKIAYSRPFFRSFGGIFPPDDVTHHPDPQKALPYAETRRLSHKA